ncbi:MAG: ribonuclease [Rickettsiales bacterium]|nr:ribonuclease [Rickettsiales bacterium]
MTRPSGRAPSALRDILLETQATRYAEGSCMVSFGHTKVLCTATVDPSLPFWLRGKGQGWVTAEYGMLPRSTHSRIDREAAKGKQSGRTQEIQRLIGRSLRSVTDLKVLGERQVIVDCDVIQADGGTRTAAITGGYVALHLALAKLVSQGTLSRLPLTDMLAAVSCGVRKGEVILDLDYEEDSDTQVDANFVMTGKGGIVEIQGTAEGRSFSEEELSQMLAYAKSGIKELIEKQKEVLGL